MKKIAISLAALAVTTCTFASSADYTNYVNRSNALQQELEQLSSQEKATDEYSFCGIFLQGVSGSLDGFSEQLSDMATVSPNYTVTVTHLGGDEHLLTTEQDFVNEAKAELADVDLMVNYTKRSTCVNKAGVDATLAKVESLKQDFMNNV